MQGASWSLVAAVAAASAAAAAAVTASRRSACPRHRCRHVAQRCHVTFQTEQWCPDSASSHITAALQTYDVTKHGIFGRKRGSFPAHNLRPFNRTVPLVGRTRSAISSSSEAPTHNRNSCACSKKHDQLWLCSVQQWLWLCSVQR